jgi:hypothetical protein
MDMQPLAFPDQMIVACRKGNIDSVFSRRELVKNPCFGGGVLDRAVIEPVLNVGLVHFWLIMGLRRIHQLHSIGLY